MIKGRRQWLKASGLTLLGSFSEEPGLYDPETGCGFNWSDTIVVGRKSGWRMSRVPYTKEWCWIRI